MTTAVSRPPTMPRRRRADRAQATEATQISIPPSEIATRAYELFVERGRTMVMTLMTGLRQNANSRGALVPAGE
jgi:hypothetical protein